jgi:hypothetical protein
MDETASCKKKPFDFESCNWNVDAVCEERLYMGKSPKMFKYSMDYV